MLSLPRPNVCCTFWTTLRTLLPCWIWWTRPNTAEVEVESAMAGEEEEEEEVVVVVGVAVVVVAAIVSVEARICFGCKCLWPKRPLVTKRRPNDRKGPRRPHQPRNRSPKQCIFFFCCCCFYARSSLELRERKNSATNSRINEKYLSKKRCQRIWKSMSSSCRWEHSPTGHNCDNWQNVTKNCENTAVQKRKRILFREEQFVTKWKPKKDERWRFRGGLRISARRGFATTKTTHIWKPIF